MLAEICRTSRSGCEKTRVRTRVGCTVYLVVVSGRSEEYEGLTMIKRNSFDADVMSARARGPQPFLSTIAKCIAKSLTFGSGRGGMKNIPH